MKMTTEEAFVKVLQRHGIAHAFGIIGSAFMPISDLFPKAGITFWDCAHEGSGGMMADGYTRATGKMAMMIAQNGPGITNFVTAVKTAYWNHTPLLLVTPQAANRTIGQGGFQEVEQMALFQRHGRLPGGGARPLPHRRGAEPRHRAGQAGVGAGADQRAARLLDAGDRHRAARDRRLRAAVRRRGGDRRGGAAALEAQVSGHPQRRRRGARRTPSRPSRALAERLDAPVCCGYQHNDAFPGSHRLFAGPLGYNGSKAAMQLIAKADVVLALGTRLNPFSTLPGYGIDYWPKQGRDHPGRHQPEPHRADQAGHGRHRRRRRQGRRRRSSDASRPTAGDAGRAERKATIAQTKSAWAQELSSMDHEDDDPGTTWNERARAAKPEWMSPRMAWRAIQAALPRDAIISSDIGNNCAIGNAYPSFETGRKYLAPGLFGPCGYGLPSIVGAKIACPDMPVVGFAGDGAFGIAVTELTAIGRKGWPAITMIVFRNYQWGAEKRNSTLWYDDNFVGTELDEQVSYAGIAQACGLQGVQARTMDELTAALANGDRRPDEARQDDADRGDDQPGARRAVPPRRDEEAGGGGGDRPEGHARAGRRVTVAITRGVGQPTQSGVASRPPRSALPPPTPSSTTSRTISRCAQR